MKLTPEQQKKLKLLQLMQQKQSALKEAFDADVLASRPTPVQLEILQSTKNIHYIVGSNRSGKTQLGAKILSYWFNEDHPYLKRPKQWGTKPLTLMMIGQVGSQMDTELWRNKLEKFLKPGSYKVVRQGNAIDYVEHKENGNRIVFIAHLDPDAARKKAQAYTAQVVWLDEMPSKSGIITELRLRVFDEDGYMYCTGDRGRMRDDGQVEFLSRARLASRTTFNVRRPRFQLPRMKAV